MAQLLNPSTNQVKLNNGQTVTGQQGGWYDGQQLWGGTLSAPGVINSQSNQQGAGQRVSNEVIAQTNPANVAYIAQQQQNYQPSQYSEALPGVAERTTAPAAPTVQGGGSTGKVFSGTASTGTLSPMGAPTLDIQGITQAAYNTPEIGAANKAVTDAQAELTSKESARATALANVNDNPFYSQGMLDGQQAKINAAFNNDAQVIQNKITQAQGQVASLKADAAIKVNAAQGQYNINEQAYKDNITQFNNLLTAGALDNASPTDLANLAVQTGIPTSMLQSMVGLSQKKNNPIQVVPSTDNQGNVTLLAVDSNGKVVNQTTIPGIAATSKTGTGEGAKAGSSEYTANAISTMTPAILKTLNSYGNISPQDWQKALAAWLGQGLSKEEFVKDFGQYADVHRGDFISAYGFANPDK